MSSLEIAELTGKRHRDVMRDIRATLEVLSIDPAPFLHVHTGGEGGAIAIFRLPRHECELVIMPDSSFTFAQEAAIRRRWDAMEALNNAHLTDRLKDYTRKLRAEVPMEEAPTFNLVVKDGERGVDLRDLHRALHRDLWSRKDFSAWVKSRLVDFVEGYDYEVLLPQMGEQNGSGGHNRIDYAVSIECAKHIAMMERTDRGRQVRQYFIDFEKAVREREATAPALSLPQTYAQALRALADTTEQNEEQTRLLEAQQSAVDFVEDYVDAIGWLWADAYLRARSHVSHRVPRFLAGCPS